MVEVGNIWKVKWWYYQIWAFVELEDGKRACAHIGNFNHFVKDVMNI